MEKIYMNNQKNQKQSFFKQLFGTQGSIALTFAIACIGVISLVAFGFNQISFAIDDDKTGAALTDSFVTAQGDDSMKILGKSILPEYATVAAFPVFRYFAQLPDGTRVPIFCVEKDVPYDINLTYNKSTEITDQGLIYLMSQLHPNKMISENLDEGAQVWITQTAIWTYLYETGDPKNTTFGEFADFVRHVTQLYLGDGTDVVILTDGSTVFSKYGIDTLIEQAKEYKTSPYITLNVNKASNTISITNDNKFYQSDVVSVVGATSSPLINNFESYTVTINNAPEGTIIIKEDGTAYTADELKNMQPTDKFYVRVPVDKVTEDKKNVEISILGNFKMYGANYYTDGSHQKVANVGILDKSQSVPLNIQLDYTPDVPDTGMSVAQIVYFIGLIVLLTGVGIIYVNTKPAEIK